MDGFFLTSAQTPQYCAWLPKANWKVPVRTHLGKRIQKFLLLTSQPEGDCIYTCGGSSRYSGDLSDQENRTMSRSVFMFWCNKLEWNS